MNGKTVGSGPKETSMDIRILKDKPAMGRAAGEYAADIVHRALHEQGQARIIVATGASQFEVLDTLAAAPDLYWPRVTVFHLDEYAGMPAAHPASFRKDLWERFHRRLTLPVRAFHYLNAEDDAAAECRRVGDLLREGPIDVACVGIGENGHLAFNDPPADFETDQPYLQVTLDEACRRQQHGEGWFKTLNDVPTHAISMSIRQIMASRAVVCSVPEKRKAEAVRNALEGPVTNRVPASILQQHAACVFFLDQAAASMMKGRTSDTKANGKCGKDR
jgi:glucosamine-6-phosphate deaminase